VLASQPPVVYAGSIERIDFGEEADDKGFYEIEIQTADDGKRDVGFNFRKIEGRRFITIDFEVKPEDLNPTAGILQAIAAQPVKDAVVRLHIKLPAEGGGPVNDSEIRSALNPAHNFTIAREMVRENRLRLGKFTAEELTPLEALKAYMDAKKVSPERAKVLMEYGEKLIAEQNEKA
jgi:exonuclease SbcD